eukprot:COSAG01_NODE_46419_length_400_cov_1.179402_1_plen_61_part_10
MLAVRGGSQPWLSPAAAARAARPPAAARKQRQAGYGTAMLGEYCPAVTRVVISSRPHAGRG